MKKEKIIIDDAEIPVEGKDVSFSGVYDPYSLEEIEKFILDAGSNSLQTFGGTYEGGIHLQQVADELSPCLIELLKYKDEIKSYLEIGSAAGGSAYIFNHFFNLNKVVLIDDNKQQASLRPEILKGLSYREIIGRSEDEMVVDAVSDLGILFDLILIDSEHDYKQAKIDVILYLPFLRPGGFLFLHDTVYSPQGDGRVARELKAEKGMEFIGEYISQKDPKCGIALFRREII